MNKAKLQAVVEKVIQLTEDGRLRWEPSTRSPEFLVAAVFQSSYDLAVSVRGDPSLQIIKNRDGYSVRYVLKAPDYPLIVNLREMLEFRGLDTDELLVRLDAIPEPPQ